MVAQAAWGETGAVEVTGVSVQTLIENFNLFSGQDWAVLLYQTGSAAFAFLVPVLSGFIAYGIANRPGLVPGFVGGAVSVTIGAGFLGGLVTGFVAGFLALWISNWRVPRVCAA